MWSQLRHVLEHSTAICMVVDCRHPHLHISERLYEYVTETLRKPFVIVLTKVDLISERLAARWSRYMQLRYPKASGVVQFSSAGKRVSEKAGLAARRRHIDDARKSYSEFHLVARWNCCKQLLQSAGVSSEQVFEAAEHLVMSARGGGRGAAGSRASGTSAKRAMLMEKYGKHAV